MDRDLSTTGAMRGSGLPRAHVLTTPFVAPGQAPRLAREQRTLPTRRQVTTPSAAPGVTPGPRKPGVAAGDRVGTQQPRVFPGRAIPGMLDGRGVSGGGQRTLPGPAMPTVMVPAVRLVRVMAGTARGRREHARAEVAG
jgi:hypothetical protein